MTILRRHDEPRLLAAALTAAWLCLSPQAFGQPADAPPTAPPPADDPAATPPADAESGDDASSEDGAPSDEGDEGDEADDGDDGDDQGDDDDGGVMGDGEEESLEDIEAEWGLKDTEDYRAPMVVPDMEKQPPGITAEKLHRHRWFWKNLLGGRINALGLTNRFQTGYRAQLFDRPETAFNDTFIAPQLDTELSPAFGYVGARLDVQPVALLNFSASYGMIGYFGTFNHVRSFPNARAEYSDDFLNETEDQQYTALGNRARLSGTFQFGLGGVYVRSTTAAFYHGIPLENGDRVFYNQQLDILAPNKGWVLNNDADLVFRTDFDLFVGLRHTVTHAFYRPEQNPGQDLNGPMHRVGPLFAYQFYEDPIGAGINKPTVIVLAQWWARHRYRTRQSPALPLIAIALRMEGDFYTSEKE